MPRQTFLDKFLFLVAQQKPRGSHHKQHFKQAAERHAIPTNHVPTESRLEGTVVSTSDGHIEHHLSSEIEADAVRDPAPNVQDSNTELKGEDKFQMFVHFLLLNIHRLKIKK